MKKFVFLFSVCLITIMLFPGCTNLKVYELAKNNIAEQRENLFVGENENIKATLISGKREKEYVINGYCTEPCEFGVLTFTIKNEQNLSDNVNYVLTIGTTRFDGILEKNPYDGTYVCDIKKTVLNEEMISAKIIAGEFVESVELKSVILNWNVNHDDALKLACKELNKELETFIENDVFNGECYIKILNDSDIGDTSYFWYVNFVSRNGKNYAVIINPISNEIMAKKTI